MVICYVICSILLFVIVLYMCLEFHYFIRVTLCVLLARFCKKRIHILQETSVKGICITTDIDTLLYHMNNARFMRELDFARIDFYERTGLYKTIRKKGGSLAVGATTVRYRRFVKLFHRYIITSKIIYWDDQSIYMEHRFITPKDNFVNAIVTARTRLINCNAEDIMKDLIAPPDGDIEMAKKTKPEMPPDLEKWLEFNAMSSAKLRNGN